MTQFLEVKKSSDRKELEDSRNAILNVLEDLHTEKVQLAETKAKDEAILASIGDGMVATDTDGKIVLVNKMFEKMLGWKETEIRGKLLVEIVPMINESGKAIPEPERPINTILKEPAKATTTTTYYKRKDGTLFPVVITTSPILAQNEFVGVVEVFRDITKEKEIDKVKSEFISLASHQLKTPPTIVKLLTERLLGGKMGTFTKKQKECFDDIRSSNERMIDIVNTLLSVSRIELGSFNIEVTKKDACAIVQSILGELKSVINKGQLKLQIIFGDKNIMVMLDEPFFRMVISNLITNAIHYTAKGGEIRVLCKTVNKGQVLGEKLLEEDCFVVVVSDTGCGIPQGDQSKIFTKFFRADNAREKHANGTGLGLYIVKSILDHSGGSIWFTSRERKGSVFYVTIPMTGMRVEAGTKELTT